MNKIVRDHYPVSRLPADLREGLNPNDLVRVVIENRSTRLPRSGLGRFFGAAKEKNTSTSAAVNRVRLLRDEWES